MGSLDQNKSLGIEFAGNQIRLVAADHAKFDSILTAQTLHLSQSLESNSGEEAVGLLQGFAKRNGLDGCDTNFSVPSEQANFIWTKLPNARRSELPDLATYKLRDQLPAGVEGTSVGVIPFDSMGDQIEALVVAVPKASVLDRAKLIRKAGLNPVGCEVEAQSLLRVAQKDLRSMSALFRQLSMTLVDIGPDRTRFIVMQDQRVQFVRTVKFGSNRLVKSASESLGASPELIEAAISSGSSWVDGFSNLHLELNGEWHEVEGAAVFEQLYKELRRLVTYFRNLRTDRSYSGLLERLILSGDLVSITGFPKAVSRTMGTRTHAMNPFLGTALEMDSADLSHIIAVPHRYAVSAGLALAEYSNKKEAQIGFTERRKIEEPTNEAA